MKDAIEALRAAAAPATLAGSLLAAPPQDRLSYATVLADAGAWLHVDLIDDAYPLGVGVSPQLLPTLAALGAPVDVHLLVAEPHRSLPDVLAAHPARVTVQLENLTDPWTDALTSMREHCATVGAQLWAGVAPSTPMRDVLALQPLVDGILIMLAEPGQARTSADPDLLQRLHELSATSRGVDGGVTEHAFADIREGGGSYAVMGRRLWALATEPTILSAHGDVSAPGGASNDTNTVHERMGP